MDIASQAVYVCVNLQAVTFSRFCTDRNRNGSGYGFYRVNA